MANIDSSLKNWSATASSNQPDAADAATIQADLQQLQATVRQDLASKGADIASATTTDLGAVAGLMHDITGTTTITEFGTVSSGIWKLIKFEGALTLTHNATSLILPGAANITTADGDVAFMVSEGSGNWRCAAYAGKNGNFTNITASGTLAVSGVITEIPRAAAYSWTAWNPSDVAGTPTAPSATDRATITAASYVTMANSGGTLTFTFAKAGNYLIGVNSDLVPAANFSQGYFIITLGGDATRNLASTTLYEFGTPNFQFSHAETFMVAATAGQTLTVLPKTAITQGGGSTANYTANASATAAYMGTT